MGLINLPKNILSATWSTRPSASGMTGYTILITDIGMNGTLFISNGTRWAPLGGTCLLYQSTLNSAVTGTLSETTLATVTIPGGVMSGNGQLEIKTLWSFTNSANVKSNRIRINNITGATYTASGPTASDTGQYYSIIRNNGLTSQQRGVNAGVTSFGNTTAGLVTSTIDTTADFSLYFTGQLANVADSTSIQHISIIYSEG